MTHDMTHLADPLLEPHVRSAIERIPTSRFSTKRLIQEVQATSRPPRRPNLVPEVVWVLLQVGVDLLVHHWQHFVGCHYDRR